jgi:acetyl esterase/lipase
MTKSPRCSIFCIIVAIASMAAFGQRPQQKQRQGQAVQRPSPVPEGVRVLSDVQYCTGGGRPLLMDIYAPKDAASKPAPAVLWIHGGGWRSGSKSDRRVATLLATNGFVSATLDYRLSGEAPFPAAIEDCKCGVRFLRANAAKYGIDPQRIGAAGGSAGGHLALLVGTADERAGLEGSGGWPGVSSRVRAVVSWFGPADFSVGHTAFEHGKGPAPLAFLGGTLEEKPEIYRRASPVTWVSADDPPILMIHGDQDKTVPFDQSVRMLKAYQKAGLNAELIKVEGADHGFKPVSAKPISVSVQEINDRTVDFFKKHL